MPDQIGKLLERRTFVRSCWEGKAKLPGDSAALALSGGGIRSATFSLGAIQALAKAANNPLSRIDILSTVSGGGYVGCFLRSLFLPESCRGIVPANGPLNDADIADQYEFARTVLASGPARKDIRWPKDSSEGVDRRNPLWWLREHSRYLAPNGPTDYVFALSYLARNWLAMLYIFLLASLALFSLLVVGEAIVSKAGLLITTWAWIPIGTHAAPNIAAQICRGGGRFLPLSPLFLLALAPIAASVLHSIAYWMTQAMSPNEPDVRRQWKNLLLAIVGTYVAAGAIIILSIVLATRALKISPIGEKIWPPGTMFIWVLVFILLLMIASATVALIRALAVKRDDPGLTSNLRNGLTGALTLCNEMSFAVIAVAIVDSLGAGIAHWTKCPQGTHAGWAAALLPVLAYLIKKLPDWFGAPGSGKAFGILQRFITTIALVVGILLFGVVAVTADTLVHLVGWRASAWVSPVDWTHLLLFTGVIWILTLLSGTATGFINLSSLHFLYSARLTRAYLGATNNKRLEAAAAGKSRITESHAKDYIQPDLYCSVDLPAPVHIINATINETIDPQSQLVARDRKGDAISLSPGGVQVADVLVPWADVGQDKAEQLSLGQWCAISGAAASSGMGRLTSLGLALALTFANVRLGYWWWSPGVCTETSTASAPMRFVARRLGTFIYLFNEMTARYRRAYERKYLTDGGHFENTAAYRLMERRVPLTLLCDNGADPKYRFEDLENLVRKVRLDMGGELRLLGGEELDLYLHELGAREKGMFVDPAQWEDWRDAFTSGKSDANVLVLRATFEGEKLHLIWLKPRLFAGMPPDLMSYSSSNPAFPQQPTGDQFFDEAQWESYRCLGELSMARLLANCPRLLARLENE